MTGSSLAPVIIPIVVVITLAAWLFLVFYADGHPSWRGQSAAAGQQRAGTSGWAGPQPAAPRPRQKGKSRIPDAA